MVQSSEYEVFNLLDYNRNINRNQVNKIKESITKHGYVTSNPIIVDKDMNIIDGQHRFTACKEMGLPIEYEIQDVKDDLIIDLNTTQRSWSLADYVKYYALKQNRQSYLRLMNLSSELNLSYNSLLILIKDTAIGGYQNNEVKEGKFYMSIDDTIRIRTISKLIREAVELLRLPTTDRLINAFVEIHKLDNFEWKRMINQCSQYPTIGYRCRTRDEYVEMLKKVYNFNSRTAKTRI